MNLKQRQACEPYTFTVNVENRLTGTVSIVLSEHSLPDTVQCHRKGSELWVSVTGEVTTSNPDPLSMSELRQ